MISIIIPLYNKAESIKTTLESVLSQSYTDFEVLIIDDGSTDDSKNIVSEIHDDRIRYIYKDNGGVSSARNYGAMNAKSEWLFFLDADDLLLNGTLENLEICRKQYKTVQVVVSGFVIKHGKTEIEQYPLTEGKITNPLKQWWLNSIFPRTGNFLISKTAFFALGGFDQRISYNEDFSFVLKMLNTYEVACVRHLSMIYTDDFKTLSVKKTPLNVELGNYLSELSVENKYSNYFIYWQYVWTVQRRLKMKDNYCAEKMKKELDSRFSAYDKLRNRIMQKVSSIYRIIHK